MMSRGARALGFAALIIAAVVLFVNFFVFEVNTKTQAVVRQFGQVVRTVDQPGWYIRIPVLQRVVLLPGQDRLLDYNARTTEALTRDQKTVIVDSYTKWSVADPALLLEKVGSIQGAQDRLDDIVWSVTLNEIASRTYDDLIRFARDDIMAAATAEADARAREFGIRVHDIRIRRIDLPEQNAQSVYARMASDRQQVAQAYLAEGEAEATRIRAETDRQVAEILAQAAREAAEIRAAGDAEAARIFAEAYSRDAEFYAFWNSLQVYTEALGEHTTLVVDKDDELARYLLNSQ
ncbi:MAG: protease modulator HflC [Bacillota bacterium]|nr:protease modulator HflC [Bacillota bacterium]REJ37685.1 MAG: protease modulator HflC [Bacillota bacterium]